MEQNTTKILALNKWKVSAAIIILVAVPAVTFFSFMVLNEGRYFFFSVTMAIMILLVFFLMFEGRRPDARALIIIAVMSAIGVIGRTIFFFAPNIKPISAIIILTGICFGRNAGFITGAVSAFVSNFIFGQGPWTPWQMLGFGIIGYLSGLFFDDSGSSKRQSKSRTHGRLMTLAYCVFGFLSVFFIYGGVVDLWTILGLFGSPTLETAVLVYTAAAFMNFLHASSTVVFLLIFVIPMKSKLDRIRIKYGLMK